MCGKHFCFFTFRHTKTNYYITAAEMFNQQEKIELVVGRGGRK